MLRSRSAFGLLLAARARLGRLAFLALLSVLCTPLQAANVEVINASITARWAESNAVVGPAPVALPPSPVVGQSAPVPSTSVPNSAAPSVPASEASAEPEAFLLHADVKFTVNARLEDLLEQGVPLHFVTELEAYRPRWYWKDELVLEARQSVRLSYQAITRQYRVSRGPLAINYASLSDALRAMGTVRSWRFSDGRALAMRTRHDVYVRFRLDKTQLPKPFQLTMLTDSDWIPVSEWKHFSFTPVPNKTAP
jgi:Domain of unknown function (DUF4390)